MKYLLKAFIYIYRYAISPFLPARCRFLPTCSAYALEAIEEHGAWKGAILTIKRISRCHPWGKHGIDCVPRKGHNTSE